MRYVKPKPGAKPWKSKQLDLFGNAKPTKAQSKAYDAYRKAWTQAYGYNAIGQGRAKLKLAKKRVRQATMKLALTHHNPGVVRVKAHTIRRAGRVIRVKAHVRKRR